MSDLISRQAAIETLKKLLYESAFANSYNPLISDVYAEMAENRIETWVNLIPPAQRWIPVSERLPDSYVDSSGEIYTDKPCNCPIVPVPPHGRLIDADALPTYDKPIEKRMMFGGEYVYTQTEIDNTPTIIPPDPFKEVE